MKILKVTDEQLCNVVANEVVAIMGEIDAGKVDAIVNNTLLSAESVNRQNHMDWQKVVENTDKIELVKAMMYNIFCGVATDKIDKEFDEMVRRF